MASPNAIALAGRPPKRRLSCPDLGGNLAKRNRTLTSNFTIIDLKDTKAEGLTRRTTTNGEEVFVSQNGRHYRHVSPATEHFLEFNGMTRSILGHDIWDMIGRELETEGNEAPTRWLIITCMIHTWGHMYRDLYRDLKDLGALSEEMSIVCSDEDFGFPDDEDCISNDFVIEVDEDFDCELSDGPATTYCEENVGLVPSETSESSDDEGGDSSNDSSSVFGSDNDEHKTLNASPLQALTLQFTNSEIDLEEVDDDYEPSAEGSDEFDYFGDDELELEEVDADSLEEIYDTARISMFMGIWDLGQADLIARDTSGGVSDESSEMVQLMIEGLQFGVDR